MNLLHKALGINFGGELFPPEVSRPMGFPNRISMPAPPSDPRTPFHLRTNETYQAIGYNMGGADDVVIKTANMRATLDSRTWHEFDKPAQNYAAGRVGQQPNARPRVDLTRRTPRTKLPAYRPPPSAKTAVDAVASTGEKVVAEAGAAGWHIPKPGLLATGITAGLAGYYAGDQDVSSFGLGAVGGFVGGRTAEIAGGWMANHLESVGKPMSEVGQKALAIGEHLTSKGGRGALFAAGALLGGGMFASMFSSGRKSYKSGFNQNRGNSF